MPENSMIPLFPFYYDEDFTLPFLIWQLDADTPAERLTSAPRRHDFYMVLFLTAGKGIHFIDFEGHPVRPGGMYFIAPYQIQYWDLQEEIRGYYIIFEKEFFHLHGAGRFLGKISLFDLYQNVPALFWPAPESTTVQDTFAEMQSEFQRREFGYEEALLAMLQVLLMKAQRKVVERQSRHRPAPGEQLVRDFLALVEDQAAQKHRVNAYAERLGVTPAHLTETVSQVTGRPAGEHIRRRLVLEIRRWLVHSDLTVAQLADKFNFSDPSYFGRFFKREIGQTPAAFRAEFRKKYQTAR